MADSLEATAALRARDRGEPAVPDGEHGSELWVGRVDHQGSSECRRTLGVGSPVWGAGAPKGFRADAQRKVGGRRRSAGDGGRRGGGGGCGPPPPPPGPPPPRAPSSPPPP